MRLLLALVLSGMTTAACAAPQTAQESLSGLFRGACIDTDLDRSAIAALAADKGWQEIPFDPGDDGPQWGVGYYLGYARVMLTGDDTTTVRDTGQPGGQSVRPAGITCEVDFRDAPAGWQDQAEKTARSLGFSPITLPSSPGDPRETRQWARGQEALLTSRHDPSSGLVSLAIMRITDPEISRMIAPPAENR